MNVFELVGTFAIEGVDKATGKVSSATSEAKSDFGKMGKGARESADDVERGMDDAGGATKKAAGEAQGSSSRFRSAMDAIGEGAKKAGELAVKGLGVIAGAATGAVAGLSALAGESMEYTESSNRLATAADAVGVSQERANETYRNFLGLTGDSDQATEAAQDMLNLAQAGGDIDTWYDIAAGSVARFGDALPVENLIESANETIRTGQIVGSMADAVNWASASSEQWTKALDGHPAALKAFSDATAEGLSAEDAFNAALAACSDEAERSAITQSALNEIYGETGKAYQDANRKIIEARKAEDDWAASTAAAGDAVLPVRTAVLGLAAGLVQKLVPGLAKAGEGLAGMFEGKEGAAEQFSEGITDALTQAVDGVIGMLPTLLQAGVSIVGGLAQGIIAAVPGLVEGLAPMLPQLVTMVIGLLAQLADQVTAMLPTVLPLIVQAISGMAVAFVQALPTWTQAFIGLVQQLVAMLPTLMPMLLQAAVSLLMAIVQAVPQIIPPLIGVIPTVVQAVCTLLPTLIPLLLQAAIQLFMALVDCLPQIIPPLVAAIPVVIDAVITMLPTLIPLLLRAAVQLFMALVHAVPQILGSLLGAFGDLLGQIPGKITGFAGQLASAAGDMLGGMVRGITGAAGRVWNAITNVCSNALGAVKSFFGIRSPSRVMRKVFGYVGEGMALGLADSEGGVLDAMQGIVEDASGIAEGFGPELAMDIPAYKASRPAARSQGASPEGGSDVAEAVYRAVRKALGEALADIPVLRMVMDDGSADALAWRLAPTVDEALGTMYGRGAMA